MLKSNFFFKFFKIHIYFYIFELILSKYFNVLKILNLKNLLFIFESKIT